LTPLTLTLVLALALAASLAGCGGDDKPTGKDALVFSLVGFSDHAGPDGKAPADAVAPGGTLRACNPQRLIAFIDFSNLQPPKQFLGTWTRDDALVNQQPFLQDRESAQTFFEVQNTPSPLAAGNYRFQLRVESSLVTEGSFTLAC
jgi:hypothetical protein